MDILIGWRLISEFGIRLIELIFQLSTFIFQVSVCKAIRPTYQRRAEGAEKDFHGPELEKI